MWPTRSEFIDLAARHRVIPLSITLQADRETPITVFEKLANESPEAFLLESVEGGDRWARWSFVGWDPIDTIISEGGVARSMRDGTLEGNPLDALDRYVVEHSSPPAPHLPPLHTGLVGYLSYDAVRYVEHLPARPTDDLGLPEMIWMVVGSLAAFDRFRQEVVLVRNVFPGADPGATYDTAAAELRSMGEQLGKPAGYQAHPPVDIEATVSSGSSLYSTMTRDTFESAVSVAKEYIGAGDAFQIVLSQRLATPYSGDGFDIYRALRLVNPSPYLFYVRHPTVAVAGSSPELMTRVRDGRVTLRPIAGTKPRGATPEEDARLAEELLADEKERAEHVMLIDLSRNDVGRVSEFGSVHVEDLMVIERYSHVMHIVSEVSGILHDGVSPVDVIKAVFPHGTVSGAPKVRAMEIIDELEPVARGPYAGAVGYLDFSGNIDTAICLRTVVTDGKTAWVQAGAGIVADSDPATEYEETMNKAAAALTAVERARDV